MRFLLTYKHTLSSNKSDGVFMFRGSDFRAQLPVLEGFMRFAFSVVDSIGIDSIAGVS